MEKGSKIGKARIQLLIDKQLDNRFRQHLAKKGLLKKGCLSNEISRLIKKELDG